MAEYKSFASLLAKTALPTSFDMDDEYAITVAERNGKICWSVCDGIGTVIDSDMSDGIDEAIVARQMRWAHNVVHGTDKPVDEKSFKKAFVAVLDKLFYVKKHDDGFIYELDADREDALCNVQIKDICESEDPNEYLFGQLQLMYDEAVFYEENHIIDEILKKIGLTQAEAEDILGRPVMYWMEDEDILSIELPEEHFLDQKVSTNIFVDTGDGNVDFTANAYWDDDELGTVAAINWLIAQQGYTVDQLKATYETGEGSEFLRSVAQELDNNPSSCAALVFCVEMTLRNLIALNQAIKKQDIDGHQFDARKKPDCGILRLSPNTTCGLFNAWDGGGSLLEIDIEKPIELPVKFIDSAQPDGCRGVYGIKVVYGPTESMVWKDTVCELISG